MKFANKYKKISFYVWVCLSLFYKVGSAQLVIICNSQASLSYGLDFLPAAYLEFCTHLCYRFFLRNTFLPLFLALFLLYFRFDVQTKNYQYFEQYNTSYWSALDYHYVICGISQSVLLISARW